jgi:CxxC motif-containing protein (DUF1111 family)
MRNELLILGFSLLTVTAVAGAQTPQAGPPSFRARDPGVRAGSPGAGAPVDGLTPDEARYFTASFEEFEEFEEIDEGLGPRFNFPSCGGCHAQPAPGGTAPAVNPQATIPDTFTANVLPSFIRADGPVREARFKYKADGSRDGGVHALFVVTGHDDAPGCTAEQEDFAAQVARDNVIFRIPTPVFGAGLIEQIPDRVILANQAANARVKGAVGISGRPNRNDNDGTITRFGWKAQNKSLLLFSGEAYNVEMGITSELFQIERDENPTCQYAKHPNTVTPTDDAEEVPISPIEKFAFVMRLLAPPTPSPDSPGGSESIARGRRLFATVGCALCHTPTLRTGDTTLPALANRDVNLFSDLLLHGMGPGLADDIIQGASRPDEFRTAPLWGLGQRIFFLHDGRTTDLVEAIRAHRSAGNGRFGPSEANAVIEVFTRLPERDTQDLLNFLRSL